MAVLWAFFFNARLFPISLAGDSFGALAPLTLYLVYGMSLLGASALAIFLECQPQAARYRRFCAVGSGFAGLAGALIVVFPYGNFSAATLLIGVGTGAMAVFLVFQFWYWTVQLRYRGSAEGVADAAVGLALFCAAAAPAALVQEGSPLVFAALPLISLGCTAFTSDACPGSRSRTVAASCVVGGAEGGAVPSESLVRRVLVPAVVYFYVVQAMNVGLDMVTLLPIASFRPWVFAFAVMAVAALVWGLLRSRVSPLKRLAQSFNLVSACLLTALFVTCCQTVGLLPVGNYAVVAAKILLVFFIWSLLVLRPADKQSSVRSVALLFLFLLLVLWLPNLVQSAILAAHPAPQTPGQLSWLFLVLSGLALVISVVSNMTISSLVTGAPAEEAERRPDALIMATGKETGTAIASETEDGDASMGVSSSVDKLGAAVSNIQHRFGLSDREVEITRLACEGKTAKRIARELFIAESTAYTHLKHIYRKVGVHSKQELVDLVEDLGAE